MSERMKLFVVFPLVFLAAFATILDANEIDADKSGVADKKQYLADVSAALDKKWPNNREIRVVCHGHSVPAGYFKTPVVDTFNAYPHLLHRALKERHPYAVINVIMTAIGGEESRAGAERFERDVLSLHPDVVTIDYALNDRRIGLEKAREAWTRMIEMAKAQGARVILLTPTGDLSSDLNDAEDPLRQHARQIEELARLHEVGLADSLGAFRAHIEQGGRLADLMSQGNHPNRKGHELVTEKILEWFFSPRRHDAV